MAGWGGGDEDVEHTEFGCERLLNLAVAQCASRTSSRNALNSLSAGGILITPA